MTTVSKHSVFKKADSLEFVWHNLNLGSSAPPISEELKGLNWKVRLDGSTVGDDNNITFKISCNEDCNSIQWSAKASYSIELYSSPDLIDPIDKQVHTFSASPLDSSIFVNFGHGPQVDLDSSLSDEDEEEEDEEVSDDDENEDEERVDDSIKPVIKFTDLSKVTHCRCVLFDISSTGLKLSQSMDLAPWKLTDESAPHDKVLLVDGVKFYVQSQVLSLWSPYFDKLFNSKFSEGKRKVIELKDVDSANFEQVLQYIYPQDEQPVIDGLNVEKLLELSDRFAISRLFERCRKFLKNSSYFNVFETMQLADRYSLMDVQEHALQELLKVGSLNKYIEEHQCDYNVLPLAARFDVLNVFRLREKD